MRSSLCLQSAQATPSVLISKPDSSGEGWYLVDTLPQQKAQAEYQLRRQGFRPFLPPFNRTIRHARRLQNVWAPAFSRYRFVPLDLSTSGWTPINGTIAVSRLVMAQGKPQPVLPGVIETLIDNTDGTGVSQLLGSYTLAKRSKSYQGPLQTASVNSNASTLMVAEKSCSTS
jgi:hypothetical protein